jgi:DNA-binding NtrC family response regulator
MKHVLIVDDEKTFKLTLLDGLRTYAQDFHVLTAENGKKAKEILEIAPVNVVVTDLKMAEMDGLELLAYMRKHHPHIPVIVMTAFGNPELENWLRSLGIFAYLEKPFDFNDLKNMIFSALASKGEALKHGNFQYKGSRYIRDTLKEEEK